MLKAMPLNTLCVFCASRDGARPSYQQIAEELGRELARRKIALVYGGATAGLMGRVANAALAGNGRVVGVIPHVLVDKEVSTDGCTELHVVDTMHTRKALMARKSQTPFLSCPAATERSKKCSKSSPGRPSASIASRSAC